MCSLLVSHQPDIGGALAAKAVHPLAGPKHSRNSYCDLQLQSLQNFSIVSVGSKA